MLFSFHVLGTAADIVGFTAWSSVREPFQVFTLLETVYNAFDRIAKKLRIFKVETIGDCYVAAAGKGEFWCFVCRYKIMPVNTHPRRVLRELTPNSLLIYNRPSRTEGRPCCSYV